MTYPGFRLFSLVRKRSVLFAAALALANLHTANAAASGDPLDLPALKGKVVYVDFWASWCAPCKQSFPWMDSLQRELNRDDFVIVAVNVDQDRADADRFLETLSPSFRIAFDREGALAERFHVQGMPTSVLIDRNGRTLWVHQGFRLKDRDELGERIRAAIATP